MIVKGMFMNEVVEQEMSDGSSTQFDNSGQSDLRIAQLENALGD